jgi:hypothetical protein
MTTALVKVPRHEELGPAMRALEPMQQRFVVALAEFGDDNHTRAAKMAGYTDSEHLKCTAYRLASNPKVQAAIQEVCLGRLHGGKILAVSKLIELAHSVDQKIALKAATELMNRTGLHAVSEHNVKTQDVSRTDDAMIARIIQLANKIGVDPNLMLGQAGVKGEIIDGEFKEVTTAPIPEHDSEGLEDIL